MAAGSVTPIPACASETAYLKQDRLERKCTPNEKKGSQPFVPRFFLISPSPGFR